MATAYSVRAWTELFVASAGASAALTGLLFVAVSVNLERILQFAGLPERALQTLLLLLSAVLVSLICLIPGQSTTVLGAQRSRASLAATIDLHGAAWAVGRLPLRRRQTT